MAGRRFTIYTMITLGLMGGLFTGRAALFTLAYLFIAIFIIGMIWAWLAVRGLGISRVTRTRRSQVGRTFGETFVVRNKSWLPKLWLEMRDFSTLPGHRASNVVPPLRPRRDYQWHVETPCRVRGEFTLGPMMLTSGDPFGLFLLPRHINAVERVIVYPAIVPLERFSIPIGLLTGGEMQAEMTQQVTTNAAGVREYVPGDSINRIHWKATAKRGKLIVKEFELDPIVDLWLLVDFSARSLVEDVMMQRVGRVGSVIPSSFVIPPSTEEYAVVIAASLAQYFIDDERSIGFAAYSPNREVLHPDRNHRQLTRILETLAVARSFSERGLSDILTLEAPNFTRGTTLVIVTSSLDSLWIQEAQRLTRRGVRPVCIYIDPATFGGAPSEEIRGMLQLARIPTLVIRNGDNLAIALTQRPI
jgi:uncharacterized protein (DUF58 family)